MWRSRIPARSGCSIASRCCRATCSSNLIKEGRLAETWNLATPATEFAGLGPFRFVEHVPGERLVLERNPFYWKEDRAGNQLPYLDRVVFIFVPSEDAQALRFQAGEADIPTRLSATNFEVLLKDQPRRNYELKDLGAGLTYEFLFFNLNDLAAKGLAEPARRQRWFRREAFRQAVSSAIDRDGHRAPDLSRTRHAALGACAARQQVVGESVAAQARPFDRTREAAASEGGLLVAAGRHADRRSGAAGGVHDPHQFRQRGADADRHDHSRRPEADRDARGRRPARSKRDARSGLDDA